MPKKIEKFVKYTELSFHAKPEKIELLRKYCQENNIDLLTVAESIPESKFDEFDKFLLDNEILEE